MARHDLLLSVKDNLDSSGDYISAWVETESVFQVRVASKGGGVAVELIVEEVHPGDGTIAFTHIADMVDVNGHQQGVVEFVPVTGAFKVRLTSGGNGTGFFLNARAVSGSVTSGLG